MQLDLLSWQPEPGLMVEPDLPAQIEERSPKPSNKHAIDWYECCISYNRRQMLRLMQQRDGSEGKQRSRKHLISSLQVECVEWLAKIEENQP